jgi:hypothetical protein
MKRRRAPRRRRCSSPSASARGALLLASGVVSYFVLRTTYGFLAGMVDLTMNAAGARVERGLGRPVLASMHRAASAGVAPRISCAVVIAALWGCCGGG